MPVPEADLRRVADAHERCRRAIAPLTDADVGRASLLPGWSVAHVLSHLARNADSHVRRAEAALRGDVVDQYIGGSEGRDAEIEAGAGRSARELIEDVERSCQATETVWRELPVSAWLQRSRDASGMARYLFELPARRWQEVEVHVVDLAVGITPDDWPDDFVLEWLPRTRERMRATLPAGLSDLTFRGPAEELAWLYGRSSRGDLPTPPSWG